MKTLSEQFTKNGFNHRLVERIGQWAIYERQHYEVSRPHWEVVRVRINPERLFKGHTFTEGEAYPQSERWGSEAWTCTTLEDARVKLAALAADPAARDASEGSDHAMSGPNDQNASGAIPFHGNPHPARV